MNLTGSPDYAARIVYLGDPGSGCSGDQYRQFNTAAVTGPQYGSVGLESGRNLLGGCPDKTVDLAIARNIRLRRQHARSSSASTCSTCSTPSSTTTASRNVIYRSPTDLTIVNSQTLPDGSLDPARLTPRTAGSAPPPARSRCGTAAAAPVRVLTMAKGLVWMRGGGLRMRVCDRRRVRIDVRPRPLRSPPLVDTRSGGGYSALVRTYCVACHNDQARRPASRFRTSTDQRSGTRAESGKRSRARCARARCRPRRCARGRMRRRPRRSRPISRPRSTARRPRIRIRAARPCIDLNRAEYSNAIRDLLAVDVRPGRWLPVDDSGYGFDNIAAVLSTSPALLDRYMSAAHKVSRLAVGDLDA